MKNKSLAIKEPHNTPMIDDQVKALLVPHETIRDPIHCDITITALERAIIDVPAFQRLRSLLQLGPTHLVYPGAVHTRFMHSLGTLHWAEKLVKIANDNYLVYSQESLIRIEPYQHLLIRICALLHDVAHMPFGHTLEHEGKLADPEWKDTKRVEKWLGDNKEITDAIFDFLIGSGVPKPNARQFIEDVRRYVQYPSESMELDYPFIADFVGNTLCADLLDYLDRDMRFCGLREKTGDRVIKYIATVRVKPSSNHSPELHEFLPINDTKEGKGRMVLLAYRYEREHFATGRLKPVPKSEILSEAIDLLRRRFALAEKVYFHRSKLSASAMLISAMNSASLNISDIYGFSDSELLRKLGSDSNPRVKRLIDAYKRRCLYKPVYRLNYREECDTDQQSKKLWREIYPSFRDPSLREEKEVLLENYSNLPPGSIAIYCPDRSMNLKEFEMLVQSSPESEIKPLGNILDRSRKLEMDAINQRFVQLWRLLIFVDPREIDVSQVSNENVQDLSALCEDVIEFPNDIEALQGKGHPLKEQLANKAIQEWEKEANNEKVPHGVFEELVRSPHRKEDSDLMKSIKNHLHSLMKKNPEQLKLKPTAKKNE